jgi:hypothetical protein
VTTDAACANERVTQHVVTAQQHQKMMLVLRPTTASLPTEDVHNIATRAKATTVTATIAYPVGDDFSFYFERKRRWEIILALLNE